MCVSCSLSFVYCCCILVSFRRRTADIINIIIGQWMRVILRVFGALRQNCVCASKSMARQAIDRNAGAHLRKYGAFQCAIITWKWAEVMWNPFQSLSFSHALLSFTVHRCVWSSLFSVAHSPRFTLLYKSTTDQHQGVILPQFPSATKLPSSCPLLEFFFFSRKQNKNNKC